MTASWRGELALDLEQVRRLFPDHEITEDRSFKPVRYYAIALHLRTSPSVVITSDLAELAAVLSGGVKDQQR